MDRHEINVNTEKRHLVLSRLPWSPFLSSRWSSDSGFRHCEPLSRPQTDASVGGFWQPINQSGPLSCFLLLQCYLRDRVHSQSRIGLLVWELSRRTRLPPCNDRLWYGREGRYWLNMGTTQYNIAPELIRCGGRLVGRTVNWWVNRVVILYETLA